MGRREENANPGDHYTRGALLYSQGRYEEALLELEPLLKRDDLTGRVARFYCANANRAIGVEALRAGRFDLAERSLRAAVKSIGRDADLIGYLAGLYVRTGRYDRCASEMEKLAGRDSRETSVLRRLAQAQWRSGRRTDAHMTLTSALRRLGDHCELHLQLGLFCSVEHRWSEATDHLARAVEADCTNGEARYYHGLALAASGDARSAVRSLRRAFELRPNDLMLGYQLAFAAKVAVRSGEGIAIRPPEHSLGPPSGSELRQLAQYVAGEPDFIAAFVALPATRIDTELFGALLGVVRMALVDHPEFADLHFHCSQILGRLGRREDALRQARQAVRINPRYVRALVQLATLCTELDRPDEAMGYLEQAIDAGADFADVHCMAGELMTRCNRTEKARRHLLRALQLNPRYVKAAELLSGIAA